MLKLDQNFMDKHLQYKMFLLNLTLVTPGSGRAIFTIQNVSIKYLPYWVSLIVFPYLQYKMFLLNK